MVEKYPAAAGIEDAKEDFDLIKDIVVSIRNARSENKIEPARKVEATIYAGGHTAFLQENDILLKSLRTGINVLEIKERGEKIPGAITAVVGDIEIYLLGAVDAAKERARLEKEAANLEKFIAALKGKLANQDFIARAPEKVVAVEKAKLAQAEAELAKFKSQLNDLA
jgi:valyl-tRNA synthetase